MKSIIAALMEEVKPYHDVYLITKQPDILPSDMAKQIIVLIDKCETPLKAMSEYRVMYEIYNELEARLNAIK